MKNKTFIAAMLVSSLLFCVCISNVGCSHQGGQGKTDYFSFLHNQKKKPAKKKDRLQTPGDFVGAPRDNSW